MRLSELGERTVVAPDLVEELDRDPFAFGADRVGRPERAERDRGPFCRQISGEAAFDHHAQHGVQPTDRTGPARDQLVVTVRQQPQHLPVILERHGPQVAMP